MSYGRQDAPHLERRAQGSPEDSQIFLGARRSQDQQQGRPPGTQEPGPRLSGLLLHPKVDSDLAALPPKVTDTFHERVDLLRSGERHSSTHPLNGPLKGWHATSLGGNQFRMVHRFDGGDLQVLSAGNHDQAYNLGKRRASTDDDPNTVYMIPTEHVMKWRSAEYDVPMHQVKDEMHNIWKHDLESHTDEDDPWVQHNGPRQYIEHLKKQISSDGGIHTPIQAGPHGVEDGHHRLIAAHELGISHVPVWLDGGLPRRTATYHPEDQSRFNELMNEGGFSRNSLGHSPRNGYMVGLHPDKGGDEHVIPLHELTPHHIMMHRKAAEGVSPEIYQGGWVDGGHAYLDRSVNVSDRSTAIQMGRHHQQLAIWDVKNRQEIPTSDGRTATVGKMIERRNLKYLKKSAGANGPDYDNLSFKDMSMKEYGHGEHFLQGYHDGLAVGFGEHVASTDWQQDHCRPGWKCKDMTLPTSYLLKGSQYSDDGEETPENEHNWRRAWRYSEMMKKSDDWKDPSWDPEPHVHPDFRDGPGQVHVQVSRKGNPSLLDGNHRTMAADIADIKEIPNVHVTAHPEALHKIGSQEASEHLDRLKREGYCTDEWKRWQGGGCGTYATALIHAHPHLKLGVSGYTFKGGGDASEGWGTDHFFAHDKTHAYDSAGKHPLPYLGVHAEKRRDYVETGHDPEDWEDADDEGESHEDALAHAKRNGIMEGRYGPHVARKEASKLGHFIPHLRVFTHTCGLDHRLWDADQKLKPEVRTYILQSIAKMWAGKYAEWGRWARVYFAGSEASEWTSDTLEGNNDFDVLIGVDYGKFRKANPAYADMSNQEITDQMNQGFRPYNGPVILTIDGLNYGPFDRTTYVNVGFDDHGTYDLRVIKPYAAYDVTENRWLVKSPHLPHWSLSELPTTVQKVLRATDTLARDVLKLPEPERTQQAAALFDAWHSDRSRAFGPNGEGWWDIANLREKWLDQSGLWAQIVDCKHRFNEGLGAAPADWSNDPKMAVLEDTILLHRGISDYDGRSYDGKQHQHAHELLNEICEDHPHFGHWWSPREDTARFYAGPHGTVVSAEFPADAAHEYTNSEGHGVDRGTVGQVRKVTVGDHTDKNAPVRELPVRDGLTVTALSEDGRAWSEKKASLMMRPSELDSYRQRDDLDEPHHQYKLQDLRDSISQHGYQPGWGGSQPILLGDTPEGPTIRDGSHRLRVLRELGYDAPIPVRTAVTEHWPPYLTEREDEYGDTYPVNTSRANVHGPTGTEEDAHSAGLVGPFFHGTSKRRAQDIRRNGFRQPRMHNWEMHGAGNAEEVDLGNTHRTFFAESHGDALHFARFHHGDDADVVTAYIHPDHIEHDKGGGWMPSKTVKDVAHVMAITNRKRAGKNGDLPEGLEMKYQGLQFLRNGEPTGHINHEINAFHRNVPVGKMRLDGSRNNTVSWVDVDPRYRRRGVARAMWEHAQYLGLNPQHSDAQTEAGEQWASKTAGLADRLDEIGRKEHPNVDHYRSGGMGHLEGDESRSVVGFVPTQKLFGYEGNETHDRDTVHRVRDDINSGKGITNPLMMIYDHKNKWAYLGEGNHRLEGATEAGARTVPVRFVRGDASYARERGIGGPMSVHQTFNGDPSYVPTDIHPYHFLQEGGQKTASRADRVYGGGLDALFPPDEDGPPNMTPVPWPQASRSKTHHTWDEDRVARSITHPDEFPTEQVDPRRLHATQPSLLRAGVKHYAEGGDNYGRDNGGDHRLGNDTPRVYRHENGEDILLTGHHRAAAAMVKGEPLSAKIVEGGWGKPRT